MSNQYDLVRVDEARNYFKVSGKGLTVAVLDTGLSEIHVDANFKVLAQHNFTTDNDGNRSRAHDTHGHGTHVSGIICAKHDHIGIAPEANIVPIKVLNDEGDLVKWKIVDEALQWIIDNHNQKDYKIATVCMALGDGNYQNDGFQFEAHQENIREKIKHLKELKIPTVVPAGNGYYIHSSNPGMGFPAILRETISVGAVYLDKIGGRTYKNYGDARAYFTKENQITPYSQRLPKTENKHAHTDIFAPGDPITSLGIKYIDEKEVKRGTSQAAPVVAGILLLMQEFYYGFTNRLPSVDQLKKWLVRGGVEIYDGDDEADNVTHTEKWYTRADAWGSLREITQDLSQVVNMTEKFSKAFPLPG